MQQINEAQSMLQEWNEITTTAATTTMVPPTATAVVNSQASGYAVHERVRVCVW